MNDASDRRGTLFRLFHNLETSVDLHGPRTAWEAILTANANAVKGRDKCRGAHKVADYILHVHGTSRHLGEARTSLVAWAVDGANDAGNGNGVTTNAI